MKAKDIFYLIIIALIIIFWRSCPNKQTVNITDYKRLKDYSDSVVKLARKEEAEMAFLKGVAKMRDSVRVEWKTKWKQAKEIHDSIPCEEKLPIIIETCDSLIAIDDSLISTQAKTIAKADSVIKHYKQARTADSTNISNLTPRQYLFLGGDVTTGGNVFPTVGLDTKKGLFTVGYDPFQKQFKAGAYFKIKIWKRRK